MAKSNEVKTVVAKLRCLDHRGETVHTRWGNVTFDRDGLAELEVSEDELPMLRAIRPHSWLADDHTSYQMSLRGEGGPDVEVTTEPTFDVDGMRADGSEKPAAVAPAAPPAAPPSVPVPQASSKGRRQG